MVYLCNLLVIVVINEFRIRMWNSKKLLDIVFGLCYRHESKIINL